MWQRGNLRCAVRRRELSPGALLGDGSVDPEGWRLRGREVLDGPGVGGEPGGVPLGDCATLWGAGLVICCVSH